MNCFQLVKSVLDDTYSEISGKADEQIEARLAQFRSEFGSLLSGKKIEYEEPVSRFAYLYAYVTSHANMVCDVISSVDELDALFKQERVTTASIGGGPGSDVLGMLKYLDRKKLQTALTCYLLDRNKTWHECWCDLDSKVDTNVRLNTSYLNIDVCAPDTYKMHSKYLKADLFTFIYFVSEVYAHLKEGPRKIEGVN
jgi:hypothetical protein